MKPTFIACGARSGSTLLRWLIDAHPSVACPSETDAAQVLAAGERFCGAWAGPDDRSGMVGLRRAVEALVEQELARRHKSVWCDKSLSTALNLDLLARTWMSARFVFLHRHIMDFIASALGAQPFGLTDYGFPQYAAQCPGDDIGALARYWVERTSRMLLFERGTGHRTVRVRYEDITADPTLALAPVWDLLGVAAPADTPTAAFSTAHDGHGPGDHQIWYTEHISTDGVGSGARIPAGRISGALRQDVNDALLELGYDPIDDGWGAAGPLDPHVLTLRIAAGHTLISETETATPGTVVVEQSAVEALISGALNIGTALRTRAIRYYGPAVLTYGAEKELFGRLPAALAEMVV